MSGEDAGRTIGAAISETAQLLRKRFDQRLRLTGSTRAQWHALFRLSRQEGTKQTELAEALDVEPITMTRLLDRLERTDWVKRQPDPNDRRARRLYLTDKAREAIPPLQQIAAGVHKEAMTGLSLAEQEQLQHLLGRVRANLVACTDARVKRQGG